MASLVISVAEVTPKPFFFQGLARLGLTDLSFSPHIPTLDPGVFCRLQAKIENLQVRLHVVGSAGPRQRDHADLDREAEDDLGDGALVILQPVSKPNGFVFFASTMASLISASHSAGVFGNGRLKPFFRSISRPLSS